MKPDPDPCSIWGRRGTWKKSSKPGGRRRFVTRSRRSDLMNTTAGFTCSATEANASPRSTAALARGIGRLVSCGTDKTAASPRVGSRNAEANATPSANARVTSVPNFNQSRVFTDIRSPLSHDHLSLFFLILVHDLVIRVHDILILLGARLAIGALRRPFGALRRPFGTGAGAAGRVQRCPCR